jgi:hypothetical protein
VYSWEVYQRAMAGYRKGVAADLHVSGTLVDRWCHDPIDGDGVRNAMQCVLETVASLRRQGAPDADLIPTEIATELGFIILRLPDKTSASLHELGKLLKETGELVTTASCADGDGVETLDEKRRILSELIDVLHVGGAWASALRDDIAKAEKRCLSDRMAPGYAGSLKTFVSKSR